MRKQEIQKIRRGVKALQQQLAQLGPVMRGSVVTIGTRNKQPYFSVGIEKKTHLIYLGKKREPKAQEYVANYQKLRDITEQMTILNMKLLKDNACS